MKMGSFAWGLGVGMVAGVVVDMVASPWPKARKTTVGKAMQRMGREYCSPTCESHHSESYSLP